MWEYLIGFVVLVLVVVVYRWRKLLTSAEKESTADREFVRHEREKVEREKVDRQLERLEREGRRVDRELERLEREERRLVREFARRKRERAEQELVRLSKLVTLDREGHRVERQLENLEQERKFIVLPNRRLGGRAVNSCCDYTAIEPGCVCTVCGCSGDTFDR